MSATANVASQMGKEVKGLAAGTAALAAGAVEGVKDSMFEVYDAIVERENVPSELLEAPTPEDRWFDPKTGWPGSPAELPPATTKTSGSKYKPHSWEAPPPLCPTARMAPELFERVAGQQIGEVRIEVLQCESLPKLLYGVVDPYALIVVEGFAGRTSMVRNNMNPSWGADEPRAFKFPIIYGFSTINIAINDQDAQPIMADATLGRVSIGLGQLLSRTTYDCWFGLQAGGEGKPRISKGLVRLRFSVTWRDERLRIASYTRPPPKYFVVPFLKRKHMRSAIIAARGHSGNPNAFSWRAFNANLSELKQTIRAIKEAILTFLFWEGNAVQRFANAAAFFLFQWVVQYPTEALVLLPAGIIMVLVVQYLTLPTPHPIERKLTVSDVIQILLCGMSPPGLTAEPSRTNTDAGRDTGAQDGNAAHDDETDDETTDTGGDGEESHAEGRDGASDTGGVSARDGASTSSGLAGRMGAKVISAGQTAVEQGVRAGKTAARTGIAVGKAAVKKPNVLSPSQLARRAGRVAGKAAGRFVMPVKNVKATLWQEIERMRWEVEDEVFNAAPPPEEAADDFSINPLASVLNPIARAMNLTNGVLRVAHRMLTWDDPILSLQLCMAVLVVTILFLILGIAAAAVPWGLVWEWTFRLLGAAALGPHMYWIGGEYRGKQARRQAEADEFARADPKRRKEILAVHRQRLRQEAIEKLDRSTSSARVEAQIEVPADPSTSPGAQGDEPDRPAPAVFPSERQPSKIGPQRVSTRSLIRSYKFYTLLTRPTPTASHLRHRFRPEASRSYAYPLYPSEDRPGPAPENDPMAV